MSNIRMLLAAGCTLAVACGGGSADPVAAGAATIGISAALSAALGSTNPGSKARPDGSGELRTAQPDLREALAQLARGTGATSATCTGGCGTATTGTATAHCALSTSPISCPSGGSTSGTGSVDFTFTCSSQAYTASFSFSLAFNACVAQGITLTTTSGPATFSGSVDAQDNVSMTVNVSGLQVTGSYCAKNINQTCGMNFSLSTAGNATMSGQVCGCDLTKLMASQNACTASC